MIKQVSILIIIATIGVIVGGLARSMLSYEKISTEFVVNSSNKRPTIKRAEQPITPITQKQQRDTSNTDIEKAPTENHPPLPNRDSILKFLESISSDDRAGSLTRRTAYETIPQFIKDSPELGYELLEALLEINDEQVKQQLSFILSSIDSPTETILEPWLVERIEYGDRAAQWMGMLGKWGLKTRSGFDSVLNQLTQNPDPIVISNGINAINSTLARYPLAMSPKQRHSFSAQLEQLLTSTEDNVRTAAMHSLSSFTTQDMTQHYLAGLNDSSSKVRKAALLAYMGKPTKSPEFENLVISQLQDTTLDIEERARLASFATTLEISEHQRGVIEDIFKQREEQLRNVDQQ